MRREAVRLYPAPVYALCMCLCALLLVASCAPGLSLKPVPLGGYDDVFIEVRSEIPGSDDAQTQLETSLVARLRDTNRYREIVTGAPSADRARALHVDVEIVDINRTSDVSRIALGDRARSNEVRVRVTLIDGASGAQLSSFPLNGISPGRTGIRVDWPWGSVDKAAQQVARQLASLLLSWSQSDK